jgi:transcriptional regulator with XRE-family HTH domain
LCATIRVSYKRRAGGKEMPTMAAVKIDGTKLKNLRERRFISREELAEKVGSHRDHIGRLERGEIANPRMTTIRNLAEALRVDPAELVE